MDKLKNWWATLDPRKQKWVIIGTAAALGVIVLMMVGGNPRERKEVERRAEKPDTTILGSDRGEADMAAMNAKLKTLEEQLQVQTRDREEQAQRISRLQGALGSLMGIASIIAPILYPNSLAFAIEARADAPGWPLLGAPFFVAAALLIAAFIVAERVTRKPA